MESVLAGLWHFRHTWRHWLGIGEYCFNPYKDIKICFLQKIKALAGICIKLSARKKVDMAGL